MCRMPAVGGTQKTETLLGVTRAQAELALAEKKLRTSVDLPVIKREVLISDVLDQFMESKLSTLLPTTRQRYEGLIRKYLRPSFGNLAIDKLTTPVLLRAYASWAQTAVSARTVRHAHDLVRSVCRRCVKWQIIERSPIDSIDAEDLPRLKRPESAVLSEAELRKLLTAAETPTIRSQQRRYPQCRIGVPCRDRLCRVHRSPTRRIPGTTLGGR